MGSNPPKYLKGFLNKWFERFSEKKILDKFPKPDFLQKKSVKFLEEFLVEFLKDEGISEAIPKEIFKTNRRRIFWKNLWRNFLGNLWWKPLWNFRRNPWKIFDRISDEICGFFFLKFGQCARMFEAIIGMFAIGILWEESLQEYPNKALKGFLKQTQDKLLDDYPKQNWPNFWKDLWFSDAIHAWFLKKYLCEYYGKFPSWTSDGISGRFSEANPKDNFRINLWEIF